MTTRWLAFFGCALISLPFLPAATAQTQPASINPPASAQFDVPSVSSRNSTITLSASASGSSALLLGVPALWTAQDAISLANPGNIDAANQTSIPNADTSNCRWTLGLSNAWSCKIKPLSRYGLPIHKLGHYVWPLHPANKQ